MNRFLPAVKLPRFSRFWGLMAASLGLFMTTAHADQTITSAGKYRLTVRGADGGNSGNGYAGGSGATVAASFMLQAGDVLTTVTGNSGSNGITTIFSGSGGGGGGSAVILTRSSTSSLLVVAGAGGAGSADSAGAAGISADGTASGGAGPGASGGGGYNANGMAEVEEAPGRLRAPERAAPVPQTVALEAAVLVEAAVLCLVPVAVQVDTAAAVAVLLAHSSARAAPRSLMPVALALRAPMAQRVVAPIKTAPLLSLRKNSSLPTPAMALPTAFATLLALAMAARCAKL